MCCRCDLADAGGAEGAGGISAAEDVDGPAGGCMLAPWLLVHVQQVPIAAAVSGGLSAVPRAT
jgi:hypothetical protein